MMKKKLTLGIVLIVLTVIGLFLRSFFLPNHLFFGPEQGRDFLVMRDLVVNHKLTLIGAKTDIAGVFHGPLYYYIAAVPFALSHGNPGFVSLSLVLIQVLAIPLIYFLTIALTGKKRIGLIASTLYAFSFETIVYARWLSNPPLCLVSSILFMLFFTKFLQGKRWYLIGVAFMYGVLGQLEFINYLLFASIGLVSLIWYRKMWWKHTNWKIIALSLAVAACAGFGTYVLFDLRHEFLVSKSLLELMKGGGFRGTFFGAAMEMTGRYVMEIGRTVGVFTLLPAVLVTLVSLYGWVRVRKTYPLADLVGIWMVVPIGTLYLFRHGVLEQVFVGLLPAWIIGLSFAIEIVWCQSKKIGIMLIGLLVGFSILMYALHIPNNEQVFFQKSQSRVTYENELQVVHAIYERAAGKPFYFQAFTIPVFWQDGWQYLFWYIGTKSYGYIPIEEDKSVIYVIIPKIYWDPFLSLYKKNWYNEKVQSWGTLTFWKVLGEFTVEERTK